MWAGTICYAKHIVILLRSAPSFFECYQSCFLQEYQIIGSNSAKDTVLSTGLLKLFSWTELLCGRGPKWKDSRLLALGTEPDRQRIERRR